MNILYNMGIALYRSAAQLAAKRSDKVRKMINGVLDKIYQNK